MLINDTDGSRFYSHSKKLALIFCLFISAFFAQAQEELESIDIGHAILNLKVWQSTTANSEPILALPGSGGDDSRYRLIGPLLAQSGFTVYVINQRGIKGSTGELDDLTLYDYADDVIALADALQLTKFHMLGWAMGNRTARAVATKYPERISGLALIAAGGLAKPLTEPGELGSLLGDASLSLNEKMRLARRTLFSPASSESLVRQYAEDLQYWTAARASQRSANRATPLDGWWAGGEFPMLIVQGVDDKTAPPENGARMKADFGDRITLVNLTDAGHVMGLEKPHETATAIATYLRSR
ncbi:MAG: alpha/beta fold hydrolase [Pseudohongiellaceae bacterium]